MMATGDVSAPSRRRRNMSYRMAPFDDLAMTAPATLAPSNLTDTTHRLRRRRAYRRRPERTNGVDTSGR